MKRVRVGLAKAAISLGKGDSAAYVPCAKYCRDQSWSFVVTRVVAVPSFVNAYVSYRSPRQTVLHGIIWRRHRLILLRGGGQSGSFSQPALHLRVCDLWYYLELIDE